MMGRALKNTDVPVTKGTSGILVISAGEASRGAPKNCIRCGECVDVCPMKIVPTRVAMASRYKNLNLARKYNIMACFECGSCAYVCPAGLPLVQQIRTGKALITAEGQR